jgi:threonine/homoserine/homoserine lactone efflux protein
MTQMLQGFWNALPGNTAAFLLASLFLELTPGPNMTWLAVLSASRGRKAGFQAVGGVALGLAVIGIAAAFGMAAIIAETPWIYEGLRWGGILFLLYLAWDGWRGEAGDSEQPDDLRHFWRGLTANLLNPKAAVFYIAVLPGFVGPETGTQAGLGDTLILTGFYVAIATAIHGGIVLLAGLAQPILQDPVREQWSRRILSVLLALVALWFAWSTQR